MMAGVTVLAGSCIFLTVGTWNEVRNFNLIVKSGRKEEGAGSSKHFAGITLSGNAILRKYTVISGHRRAPLLLVAQKTWSCVYWR